MNNLFDNLIAGILIFSAVLCSCSPSPRFTSKNDIRPSELENVKEDPASTRYENNAPVDVVEGVASYYAHQFNGRLTANGEIYDMYGLTAAHPSYPFETIIRVVNLSNNKKTIIRINDRMPVTPGRIIDLSYGTAIALDMIEAGIQRVRLEILEWGEK